MTHLTYIIPWQHVRPVFTFWSVRPIYVFFTLLVWFLLLFLFLSLIDLIFSSTASESDKNSKEYDNSLEILKERYAKGEIESGEFEKRKRDLKS